MRIQSSLALLAYQAAAAYALCMTVDECPDRAKLETTDCEKYHAFLARGSTSPYPGHMFDLLTQICEGVDGSCGFENIVYPAANGDGWCASAHEGALNGQQQMKDYAEKCPDSKLIVLGFSQGGSVVLDMLGGTEGGQVFGCQQEGNDPLDITSAPGKNVIATLAFGPTVRSSGQNYTVKGGVKYHGISTRDQASLDALDQYAATSSLREYCQPGDPICAADSDNKDVSKHLDYFDKWNDEAAKWALKAIKGGGASGSTDQDDQENDPKTSKTSSASHSATPTPSKTQASSASATGDSQKSQSTTQDSTGAASALSVAKVLGLSMLILSL